MQLFDQIPAQKTVDPVSTASGSIELGLKAGGSVKAVISSTSLDRRSSGNDPGTLVRHASV